MSGPNYAGYPGVRGYQAPFEILMRVEKIVGDKVNVTFFHDSKTSNGAELAIWQFPRGDIEEGEGRWFWFRMAVDGTICITRSNITPSYLDSLALDFKCSSCGVGINHGEETFNGKKTQVYCKSCSKERRKNGSDIAEVVASCLDKLATATGCDLKEELAELNRLSK